MWKAFQNDLQEFVSTVKDDTSRVLPISWQKPSDDDDNSDEWTPAQEEAWRRVLLPETFLAPLPSELEESSNIDISSKTDEIAQVLQDVPELENLMNQLVPTQVSYQDFWQRYYARCQPEIIQHEIQQEEERQSLAVTQGLSKVKNFLGNIAYSLQEDDQGNVDNNTNASSGGLFSGTGGRPPFVLNTAVSENDEEEEMGWDDEDEVEDDEEQIEFQDPVIEKLKQELKQAIDERDQLHQTVEMQSAEIKALQMNAIPAITNIITSSSKSDEEIVNQKEDQETIPSTNKTEEVLVQLRAQLEAKDAEIAALNVKAVATQSDQVEAVPDDHEKILLQQELDRVQEEALAVQKVLTQERDDAQKELETVRHELETTRAELEECRRALQRASAVVSPAESSRVASPATTDTHVKVEAPPVITKLHDDDGEEEAEGWDDDW